jgi:hypothetical protein
MARNKLKNRNVPETFYNRFLADLPANTSLLQKLAGISPTQRGRGYSRVLPEITETEWEELYQYAAEGRAQMQGADRDTTLRPAICARALAESMEGMGVANPVVYVPKRKKAVTAIPVSTAPSALDDDGDSIGIPDTPPTVDQVADVDEADDDDLDSMHGDIAIG